RIAALRALLYHFVSADLTGTEAFTLPAINRAGFHRRIQHARPLHVDRIELRARQLVPRVEPLERFAGDLPILGILELDVGGRLDLRSRPGHFALASGAAGRLLGNCAV